MKKPKHKSSNKQVVLLVTNTSSIKLVECPKGISVILKPMPYQCMQPSNLLNKAQAEQILTDWHGTVGYWTTAKINTLLSNLGFKE